MEKNILRLYDIRGKYPSDINEEVAYEIGKSYGSFLIINNYEKVAVGRDVRISSLSLYKEVIKGLIETGINVIELEECTTPMCAYASIFFQTASLMVTASHNPKDENGFKFFLKNNYNLSGDDLQKYYDFINEKQYFEGKGKKEKYNLKKDYIKEILKNIKIPKNNLKIIVDPGNGATSLITKDVFKNIDADIKFICNEPDGNFPNHHPDPSVEENLEMLKQAVIKNNADLGVAYDGDGDRIGVVIDGGKYISADLLMIIYAKSLLPKLDNKNILFDVKCSLNLKEEIIKSGGTPILYKTGASFIKNKINEEKILFGGEFSGHLIFNDKYLGIDDGIYASLRLIEILASTNKKASEILKDLTPYKRSPEIKIQVDDNKKFKVIDDICKYYKEKNKKYIDIDGLRIEDKDFMVSLRASNTGPNITLRVEATDEEKLNKTINEFKSLIEKYSK